MTLRLSRQSDPGPMDIPLLTSPLAGSAGSPFSGIAPNKF